MIIDAILDRKDGVQYGENELRYIYDMATHFEFFDLARAIDGGDEPDVKRELCAYIINNDYNPDICNYVNSVNWLDCID